MRDGKGENFGWPLMEGSVCYQSPDCEPERFIAPVAEYRHDGSHCSVTGGYVYRGQSYESLQGVYFYADYCSGVIWSLVPEADGSWRSDELLDTNLLISSFGEDEAGELYVLDYAKGAIYRLQTTP
ncbi:MAG: hypothetical protein HC802_23175 [Caldilineaceae bacterium]|nr:hypothetical protein [Caldilineaceae bacterium]